MGDTRERASRQIDAMAEKLVAQHLSAYFGKNHALHDVTLKFAANE